MTVGSSIRRLPWGMIAMAGLILTALAIWRSPPYSFHPLCTYSANAYVSGDVEIDGKTYASQVIYQHSHSRRWLATMNSAGCKPQYGTVLTFKLADDRVLIVPTRFCHKGLQVLARSGRLDVLDVCKGKQAYQDRAFIVESATRPSRWYPVSNGMEFRIVNMTAESTWNYPTDDIATIAPNLLKSDFKYAPQTWSDSPEKVIPFQRRYELRSYRAGKPYEFVVLPGKP